LARVSALEAKETVWSELYPGNRNTAECFQPAVLAAESGLGLSLEQRKRTVWRMDGGSGTDEQFAWLLERGYHVLGKGFSNRRAEALSRQVESWDKYREDAWFAEIPSPFKFCRPVRVFIKRRLKDNQFHHSYYVSTLSYPLKSIYLRLYDDRGAAEIEQFRGDKSGLGLEARRKRSFAGQQGYILLTDLAHNLLSNFYYQALSGTSFADYGPKRIVRDLFAFPGRLWVEEDRIKVELLREKQFSEELVMCLLRFCNEAKSD
jgi:hypothetical protein